MNITNYALVFHVSENDPEAIEPDSISVPSDYDNPRRENTGSDSGYPHFVTEEDRSRYEESYERWSKYYDLINKIAQDDLDYDQSSDPANWWTRSPNVGFCFDGFKFYWP